MGCVDLEDKQEGHCFNIVKRKNDYALLDYSLPVMSYNQDGSIKAFYPFIGELTKEEFEEFAYSGVLKSFDDYEYVPGNQKVLIDRQRSYIIGTFEIHKENTNGMKK